MEKIIIGKILKPQGLKGEVKIENLCSNISSFKSLKEVFIGDKETSTIIESVSIRKGYVYMNIRGYDSRDKAEFLRNRLLKINKTDLPLDNNEYFVDDLIGLNVVDEFGEKIGKILSIDSYGSADVINIGGEFGFCSIPHISHIVKNVDLEAKNFTVYRDRFEDNKI